MLLDEVGIKDTSGFNYLNGMSLFVHYTNYKSKYTEEENKKLTKKYTDFIVNYTKNNEKVIGFPEEDTVFFDGKHIRIKGELPYYIFENVKKEKIEI